MNIAAILIDALREKRREWETRIVMPVPETEPDIMRRYRLEWRPSSLQHKENPKTIEAIQAELPEIMAAYAAESSPGRWLLVKPPPGTGKTYAAIEVAQKFRYRTLFASPTHKHFHTLTEFPHFDANLWYHWLATSATNPEADGESMCRETAVTEKLFSKGWPKKLACEGLCPLHKSICSYIVQSSTENKIIAGTWEHITTGIHLNGRKFSLAIIDENPTRAILSPHEYAADDIPHGGSGPIADVLTAVWRLVSSGGEFFGTSLIASLRHELGSLDAVLDADAEMELFTPSLPAINSAHDAAALPANIAPVLLPILYDEYKASQQTDTWLERLYVGNGRLIIYTRNDIWKNLPENVIIMDATANVDYYQMLFPGIEFEVYDPHVSRNGRIVQVVANYNGHSAIEKSSDFWLEAVSAISRDNPGRRIGIVSFKKLAPAFSAIVGEENILYYGNQRGSNDLEACDVVAMIGSPSPPDYAIMNTARMLNRQRIDPFVATKTENGIRPLRTEMLRPYQYERDGMQPYRMVGGLWADSDLKTIMHNGRELEMVQALHRARLVRRDATVFIFSSVPLPERLDGIYDTYEEFFKSPPIPCTSRCGDICRHKNADGSQKRVPASRWLKIKRNLQDAAAGTIIDNETLAIWTAAPEVAGNGGGKCNGTGKLSASHIGKSRWIQALVNTGIVEKETPESLKAGRPPMLGRVK